MRRLRLNRQPERNAGMNFEWAHVIVGVLSAFLGGVGGLIAGVWRVAHIEQAIREDFQKAISRAENGIEVKVEALVAQFHDTFQALRQKIGDVELETARGFVAKREFEDFRAEYREDMRDLKKSISEISRTH
jgi:hypothetical protein